MFWFKHANTRKHVSKHSWLSGWVILNISADIAHLAQSYFSLIFSATNTYNCSWFDLTNKKICSDWKQKLGEKWPMLTTFFLTATAAITGKDLVIPPSTHMLTNGKWNKRKNIFRFQLHYTKSQYYRNCLRKRVKMTLLGGATNGDKVR